MGRSKAKPTAKPTTAIVPVAPAASLPPAILYTFPAQPPDGDALLAEIAAAGLPPPNGTPPEVWYMDGQVVLPYAVALSPAQTTTLTSVVAAHQNTEALSATRLTARLRAEANTLLNDAGGSYKLQRAVLLVLLDEINALRGWITSFKAATAAASSLANLQTRVAALPSTPDRTAAQARSAISGKINDGSADS